MPGLGMAATRVEAKAAKARTEVKVFIVKEAGCWEAGIGLFWKRLLLLMEKREFVRGWKAGLISRSLHKGDRERNVSVGEINHAAKSGVGG